jgi:hypothetical protein
VIVNGHLRVFWEGEVNPALVGRDPLLGVRLFTGSQALLGD